MTATQLLFKFDMHYAVICFYLYQVITDRPFFRLGANSEIKNANGLTPYDLAVRSDYNTILALLNEPKDSMKVKPRPRSAKSKKAKKKVRHTSSDESDSDDSESF